MSKVLPARPSLSSLKYQAKQILKSSRKGDRQACETLSLLPRFVGMTDEVITKGKASLVEAQHALALDYGFSNWEQLRTQVENNLQVPFAGDQYHTLNTLGFARLEGAVPIDALDAMCKRAWVLLEEKNTQ